MHSLTAIQRQILEVDELLSRLEESARAQPRPSVLAQIRSLEKERKRLRSDFDLVAQRLENDVCRYAIDYPDRPTIAGVSAAWGSFQKLFSDLYILFKSNGLSQKKTRAKAAEPEPIEVPQLAWGYQFASSLGVVMTLPTREGLWNDPISDSVVHAFFQIARTTNDTDLSGCVRDFGPDAIAAMHSWTYIHAKQGYGVGIEWKSHSGASDSIRIGPKEVSGLRDRLARTNIESKVEINGSLVAVDVDLKECRVRADDGREITAKFSAAITEAHAATVPARYTARFLETRSIVLVEGKQSEPVYFLMKLEPLGQQKPPV